MEVFSVIMFAVWLIPCVVSVLNLSVWSLIMQRVWLTMCRLFLNDKSSVLISFHAFFPLLCIMAVITSEPRPSLTACSSRALNSGWTLKEPFCNRLCTAITHRCAVWAFAMTHLQYVKYSANDLHVWNFMPCFIPDRHWAVWGLVPWDCLCIICKSWIKVCVACWVFMRTCSEPGKSH